MATIDQLQQEVQALRNELQVLRSPSTATATAPTTGDQPAQIDLRPHNLGDPLVLGEVNDAGFQVLTTLQSPLEVDGALSLGTVSVSGENQGANLLFAPSMTITATTTGVHPEVQNALEITTGGGVGVLVTANDGQDWEAPNPTLGIGIQATTIDGTSLIATTGTGQSIVASTTGAAATQDSVTVTNAGAGRAVYADSTSATNADATVTAINQGVGYGVRGEHKNPTTVGIGVLGVGDAHGRGGQFAGGAANLRLSPGAAATHPTTGEAGDFFVDHSARLWYCQKSSHVGVAAVWKQLA